MDEISEVVVHLCECGCPPRTIESGTLNGENVEIDRQLEGRFLRVHVGDRRLAATRFLPDVPPEVVRIGQICFRAVGLRCPELADGAA